MKKQLTACLFLLAALCPGCVVTCTRPPFDLSRAEEDPTLIGRWLIPEDEGGGSVEFRRVQETPEFQIHVAKGEIGRRGPFFTGRTGQAGGRKYMWLAFVKDEEDEPDAGRILVRYEVRGDKLTFWLLAREKVRDAVNGGGLSGGGVGGEGEVRLSGTTEELAAAISGEGLWKKEGELRRAGVK
jgi:hypothetical protein